MPKSSKNALSADEIAAKASRGEDVSAYFSNKFTVVRPVRRVNVDLSRADVLENSARGRRGSTSPASRDKDAAGPGTGARACRQAASKKESRLGDLQCAAGACVSVGRSLSRSRRYRPLPPRSFSQMTE
jgi:hypothetical protein